MDYKYISTTGALHEGVAAEAWRQGPGPRVESSRPLSEPIPPEVLELVPHSVALENAVLPLASDGETITFAAANPGDIGLADKLRFILNRNVRLLPAPRVAILAAIARNYGATETESVGSMLAEFTDTAIDVAETSAPGGGMGRTLARRPAPAPRRQKVMGWSAPAGAAMPASTEQPVGKDPIRPIGGSGVLFHVVEEGQRELMRCPDGTMEVIVGPRRLWHGNRIFQRMTHFVAHPGEFLIVRFRDGRQEHLIGPADLWLDPRQHQEITREDALQLAAKEAVVVYSRSEGAAAVARRIEYGPGLYVPKAGEWLHTFSWHASKGGSKGVEKIPNGLVFQKLWLMPDQMYHDVTDVRTSDDALLTIRLMIFFELTDIERMLDETHDPIGDFVNAATSDVVAFVGRQDFDGFKRNTPGLNELDTYRQLTSRAEQCGYRINKVVYRGYGAPASLQQMHDQAIEARTKLQLTRATEQQAQDLENYKLDSQITRAEKRRTEQSTELDHDLEGARRRQANDLRHREAAQVLAREQRRLDAELQLESRRRHDQQQRDHAAALRELGVDLTAYLTQARADRVIELRGGGRPHVHIEPAATDRNAAGAK
jgi:hypothetical protein